MKEIVEISIVFFFCVSLCWEVVEAAEPAAQRELTRRDIEHWNTVKDAQLSADGSWFAYALVPNVGDVTVVLRATHSTTERRFAAGDARLGGGSPALSPSGQWLAFRTAPSISRDASSSFRTHPALTLVEIESGRMISYPNMESFSFNGDLGDWILLKSYEKEGGDRFDLVLRQLSTAQSVSVNDVTEASFNKAGTFLAWTIRAPSGVGNGVYCIDLVTGKRVDLDAAPGAAYRVLTWSDPGDAIAFFRSPIGDSPADHALVVIAGVGKGEPMKRIYIPAGWQGFPDGYEISIDPIQRTFEASRPPLVWRADARGLFFGIRPILRREAPAAGEKGVPSVRIWNWKDARLPLQQRAEAAMDSAFSYLSYASLADNRFVRLGDSTLPEVAPQRRGLYALAYDDREGERQSDLTGIWPRDFYLVNILTGARRLVLPGLTYDGSASKFTPVLSPDGAWVLYYDNGNYHLLEVETGRRKNVTAGIPFSFFDELHGRTLKKPIDRALTMPIDMLAIVNQWSSDGAYLLLNDHWDVWAVPLNGEKPRNLTRSGRRNGIRYAYSDFDPNDECIADLSQPLYFRAFGDKSKKIGLARLDPGDFAPRMLRYGGGSAQTAFLKARNADVLAYSRGTSVEFPDWYASFSGEIPEEVRLTDANPQQHSIRWSPGARLLTYVNSRGETRQGVLMLPAGYEAGKRYPTIVAIYEKLSNSYYDYQPPRMHGSGTALNDIELYTRNGYAFFRPDILPRKNDAGMTAVVDVLAGVKAAIATGFVDADRLGLTGESFGGYETSFIIAKTELFKAAAAVDQISDLVSHCLQVYALEAEARFGGGSLSSVCYVNQPYMSGPFWNDLQAYYQNSPIFHAKNVRTPLLMRQNDLDEATQFFQGLEYFSTLRQMNKPVVLLQYTGDSHGSRGKPENEQDFSDRMLEFFDHFLKGMPAPDWWADGVKFLDMDRHLRQRQERRLRFDLPGVH